MRLIWAEISLFVLFFSLFCVVDGLSIHETSAFEVGVAKVDITPPLGMPMRGYAARKEPSNGIWDPLIAKALLMDDGKIRVILFAFDLIAPPPKEICDRIRETARERYGVSAIFFAASHTHSGPSLKPGLPKADAPWLDELERKLITIAGQAFSSKTPAVMEVGYGKSDISFDRRVVNPDGSVTMKWRNAERTPTAPIDQTVGVVGFKDGEGSRIATLVHFACHPVIMGGKNLKYSADFPGAMRAYVEERLGGECLFLQGACGNANPYPPTEPDEAGYAALKQEGIALAKEVIRISSFMNPILEESLTLTTHSFKTQFDYRFDFKDEKVKEYYVSRYGQEYFDEFYSKLPPVLTIETPMLLVGNSVAWVGFPGEFFNDFQVELHKRSPIPNTFFLGYCDELHSYFPTIQAAAEGGYGASYATYVEVGAGERLVDKAVVSLHTLAGNLQALPR